MGPPVGARTVEVLTGLAAASQVLTEVALGSGQADRIWVVAGDATAALLGADGALCFETEQSERMVVRAAPGCPSLLVADSIAIAPDSQAAYVLRSPDPVLAGDLRSEQRFTPPTMLLRLGFVSSVSCRVGPETSTLGLIGAYSRAAEHFTEGDAAVLQTLASIVAVGLVQRRRGRLLEHRAFHDDLTGLANRASAFGRLEQLLAEAHRRYPAPSVLMIDLDGFKRINDRYGHHVGDEVLRQVAARILASVPPTDLVGRLGGDEFVVVSSGATLDQLRRVAERIVGSLEQVIVVEGLTMEVSASVGIASSEHVRSVTELLQIADRAMYQAKAQGRGCVVTGAHATPPADPWATPIRTLPTSDGITLADVDLAIAGVTVAFQPIVTVGDHRVIGVEALARGPVGSIFESPERLFGVAETFGRLAAVELAAKRAAFAHPLPEGVALFVNLDPNVAVDEDGGLAAIIDEWRRAGSRQPIVAELTERALVSAPGKLLRAVERCRSLGWRIALDDMGARAESLTALRIVRPDILKLDMKLLDMGNRAQASAMAASIASYCDRFGVEVVAEGVEDAHHESTAELLGATLLQGYRFGRPSALDRIALEPLPTSILRPTVRPPRRRPLRSSDRVASKAQLTDFSRYVESLPSASDSVILAALQDQRHYTPRTIRQYTALARRYGLVGVVGAGMIPGVVDGVQQAVIPEGDELATVWEVVLLSSNHSIALLAEQVDDGAVAGRAPTSDTAPRTDADRLFRYRFATDADEVEAAAHRLLSYF